MRKPWLHLLFWLVFFLMWNRVMYFYMDNHLNRLYFTALDVSLVMLTFYGVYRYVMPHYLKQKKLILPLLASGLLIVGLSGAYVGIMLLFLRKQWVPINFNFTWTYQDMQDNRFFIALLGGLGGCFVKLAVDRINLGKRMDQLQKEKSTAELNYLKSQINPHFLFNSLNSLYAQMELNSTQARQTLVTLADLLRYQLYECTADRIPLARETAYLANYFNLQRMRLDNCRCSLSIDKPPISLLIAPLLLITFIENAFKYVSDFDDRENSISLKLHFEGNRLILNCTNTKEDRPVNEDLNEHRGIGLANVKKRLQLIYGQDHHLRIDTAGTLYSVHIEILLENAELSDH